MNSLDLVKLGTLMSCNSTNIDPRRYKDEVFELFSIPAFERGRPEIVSGSEIGSTKQIVAPNDVLLSKIVPHIRRAWVVSELNGPRQIASGEWIPFRNNRFNPSYLRHVLISDDFHVRFMQTVAGVGGSLLRARPAQVANISIPLPPLPEQCRIAAILDQAYALRAKRRKALAKVDEMAQAIFVEMFGDFRKNKMLWPVYPVSHYVAAFQGGKSLEADGDKIFAKNHILKISAVTGMVFRPTECKPLANDYEPPLEHFVRSGDLLFSRANTTDLVGAVAYVEETPSNLVLPDKLWRFVFHEPLSVDPLFIWALFQTPAVRDEIERRATGTSGSMKNISQGKLLSLPTIVPPLTKQQEFSQRIRELQSLKMKQSIFVAETDNLFASLQHHAFSGAL